MNLVRHYHRTPTVYELYRTRFVVSYSRVALSVMQFRTQELESKRGDFRLSTVVVNIVASTEGRAVVGFQIVFVG